VTDQEYNNAVKLLLSEDFYETGLLLLLHEYGLEHIVGVIIDNNWKDSEKRLKRIGKYYILLIGGQLITVKMVSESGGVPQKRSTLPLFYESETNFFYQYEVILKLIDHIKTIINHIIYNDFNI
jgi:hypothetical protein